MRPFVPAGETLLPDGIVYPAVAFPASPAFERRTVKLSTTVETSKYPAFSTYSLWPAVTQVESLTGIVTEFGDVG
jgi:hypothetical protein